MVVPSKLQFLSPSFTLTCSPSSRGSLHSFFCSFCLHSFYFQVSSVSFLCIAFGLITVGNSNNSWFCIGIKDCVRSDIAFGLESLTQVIVVECFCSLRVFVNLFITCLRDTHFEFQFFWNRLKYRIFKQTRENPFT